MVKARIRKENIFKSVGKEDQREALRGDLKFNPPPGVSFRSHGLFALRERTIVKRRTFASSFSLRSFSERGKKERARDQFKEISKRGDHVQKGNRKSASLCALSFVSVRFRSRKNGRRERGGGGRTASFSRRTRFARRERRRTASVVVVVIRNNEIVDRLFPEESSAKEGKIDQKLKRTELFRGDGPVAVFIEQSERFFEFGDLLVREFSRHDVFVVVVFLCRVCALRVRNKKSEELV